MNSPSTTTTPPRDRRANATRALQLLLALLITIQFLGAWRTAIAKRNTIDAPAPQPLEIVPSRDPIWRLTLLPGIGWKRAKAIRAWRDAGRPIANWENFAAASGAPARVISNLQSSPGIRVLWPPVPPPKRPKAGTLPR